jgi:hypothetical protein
VRRAAKVDLNHAEIVKALRKVGCKVTSLAAVGNGVPDLLCWHPASGRRTVLLEVKGDKGALTPDQVKWHAEWAGALVFVVRTPEEAIAAVMHPEG